MAIRPNGIANGTAPELRAGHTSQLAGNIPKRNVDACNRGSPYDAVTVPEMLAIHSLPKILDARRVFANEQVGEVFDSTHHTSRVPFQRGFAPTEQAILVRHHFDKDPIAHSCMTDVRLDFGDFHGAFCSSWMALPIDSMTRSKLPGATTATVSW